MLGYSHSEMLQKNWEEMTHPDDLELNTRYFNQALAGEIEGYVMDKRFIRKNAEIIYTSISAQCLRNLDKSVRACLRSFALAEKFVYIDFSNTLLVNIPIIAMTALAMTGDRKRCIQAGADEYVTKPVKLKQLTNTIQQLLVKNEKHE